MITGIRTAESAMAITDVLLPLISYPVPTETQVIESAIAVARRLDAHISGVTFEMDIKVPIGFYADPLNVGGIAAAEKKKCASNARHLVKQFETIAKRQGASHDHRVESCLPSQIPARLVDLGRLRDLTIVALKDEALLEQQFGFQRHIAEQLIFETGRPVLTLPAEPKPAPAGALDKVAVAWDFSRPATRAVADALPLLRRAKSVRIFTVVGEKPIMASGSTSELSRHLARHDVKAVVDEIKSQGRPIGEAFDSYVAAHDIDLLVMGAYGHSRWREFILGGATKSILARPPSWVFLSH
jgi:nucleotide-binding universal stress UspA family protein